METWYGHSSGRPRYQIRAVGRWTGQTTRRRQGRRRQWLRRLAYQPPPPLSLTQATPQTFTLFRLNFGFGISQSSAREMLYLKYALGWRTVSVLASNLLDSKFFAGYPQIDVFI